MSYITIPVAKFFTFIVALLLYALVSSLLMFPFSLLCRKLTEHAQDWCPKKGSHVELALSWL